MPSNASRVSRIYVGSISKDSIAKANFGSIDGKNGSNSSQHQRNKSKFVIVDDYWRILNTERYFPTETSQDGRPWHLASSGREDTLGILLPVVFLAIFLFSAVFAFRWQSRKERKYQVEQVIEVAQESSEVVSPDAPNLKMQVDPNNNSIAPVLPGDQMYEPRDLSFVTSPIRHGCPNCRIEVWRGNNSWYCTLEGRPCVSESACQRSSWIPHGQSWIHELCTTARRPSFLASTGVLSSVFCTPATLASTQIHRAPCGRHSSLVKNEGPAGLDEKTAVQNYCEVSSVSSCACRLMRDKAVMPETSVTEFWV